ncbi:hypothetical protein ABT160_33165 [Streptomyces sp. NPDC001941]|uniref:hypothetical protein n=1 Tax=Streptomyces sp. NPDC001941 TaxID=3154659 RepID=UPI00331DCFF6
MTDTRRTALIVGASRTLGLALAADYLARGSEQGSVGLNARGGQDLYRASKSALNQLMRSFAARHADDAYTLLLMDPGWVRTELGGPETELSVEESIPGVTATIEGHRGERGLHFVDHLGRVVAW